MSKNKSGNSYVDIINRGKNVLLQEAEVLQNTAALIGSDFVSAVTMLCGIRGKVIVCGVGKAGIIGRKIAASFSSLGTSSFFMHPADAVHGDLGMVTEHDIMLFLSNSGESSEISALLPGVKALRCGIIAITGNTQSILAKSADVVIDIGHINEACSLGLAPTCSTTAMLAVGDALAVVCMENNKNFDEKKYAFFHPAGALGKKLLTVEKIMRSGNDIVITGEKTLIRDVLIAVTRCRCGLAVIVDDDGKLSGVFADGDLRRHLEQNTNLLEQEVGTHMTRKPKSISPAQFAAEALKILRDYRISDIPVIDTDGTPLGVVYLKDLVDIGLM